MIDKFALKEDLKNGVLTVTFEKRDGTERTMRATDRKSTRLNSSH